VISPCFSARQSGNLVLLSSEWDLYQFGIPHLTRRIVKLSPEKYREHFKIYEVISRMQEEVKNPDSALAKLIAENRS
jgi:hypothetical protein